jgi:hypothetical protein
MPTMITGWTAWLAAAAAIAVVLGVVWQGDKQVASPPQR